MATATLYLWDRLGKTGHVSMRFDDPNDDKMAWYASWHPADPGAYKSLVASVVGRVVYEMDEDHNAHRGIAPKELTVHGLDNVAMDKRFYELAQLVKGKKLRYSITGISGGGINCAMFVADILSHGKTRHGVTFLQHLNVVWHRAGDYRTKQLPYNAPDGIEDIVSSIGLRNTPAGRAIGAFGIFMQVGWWTPRDVFELGHMYNDDEHLNYL